MNFFDFFMNTIVLVSVLLSTRIKVSFPVVAWGRRLHVLVGISTVPGADCRFQKPTSPRAPLSPAGLGPGGGRGLLDPSSVLSSEEGDHRQ